MEAQTQLKIWLLDSGVRELLFDTQRRTLETPKMKVTKSQFFWIWRLRLNWKEDNWTQKLESFSLIPNKTYFKRRVAVAKPKC